MWRTRLGFAKKQIVFKQVLPIDARFRHLKIGTVDMVVELSPLMTFRMVRLSLQDRI